jgi:hypothetical protein
MESENVSAARPAPNPSETQSLKRNPASVSGISYFFEHRCARESNRAEFQHFSSRKPFYPVLHLQCIRNCGRLGCSKTYWSSTSVFLQRSYSLMEAVDVTQKSNKKA